MSSFDAGLLCVRGVSSGRLRLLPTGSGRFPLRPLVCAFSPLPLHASVLKPHFDLPNKKPPRSSYRPDFEKLTADGPF